jgi:hypothetical protein
MPPDEEEQDSATRLAKEVLDGLAVLAPDDDGDDSEEDADDEESDEDEESVEALARHDAAALAKMKAAVRESHPDIHDSPDDTQLLTSGNPLLSKWIEPYNGLVGIYRRMIPFPADSTREAAREYGKHYLRAVNTLADGDVLQFAGFPVWAGIQLHVFSGKKRPNAPWMDNFKMKMYGIVKADPTILSPGEVEGIILLARSYAGNDGAPGWRGFGDYLAARENAVKHEDIRLRAYFKWDKAGRPPEGEFDFWRDAEKELRRDTSGIDIHIRARFRPKKYPGTTVRVIQAVTPARVFVMSQIFVTHGTSRQFELLMKTHWGAVNFSVEQEALATEKLRGMLTDEQWRQYVVTGMFEEFSEASGIAYMVRKLRPTVAMRRTTGRNGGHSYSFRAGLCMHPLAYHMDSFSGTLCPTDDVIDHLNWIRGDERRFWSRANHHAIDEMEAGIP